MHMLEIQGYVIVIKPRWGVLTSWASRPLFTDLRTVRTGRKPKGDGHLIFTDDPESHQGSLLTADYFPTPARPSDGYQVPMPMGVQFYLYRWHEQQVDRNAIRRRGIFFFGNMAAQHYDRSVLHIAFNCFTRAEVLDHLGRAFPHRIERPRTMNAVTVSGEKDIILVDRDVCYIQPYKLRPILTSFDFFLALSGVVMPLCHNLIEALSAGSIPIIPYPHLLSPPLENNVNCLSYSTLDELDRILERIPLMEESEIQRMRDNVNLYYTRYLTLDKVVSEIEKCQRTNAPVRLNAEAGSTSILLAHMNLLKTVNITSPVVRGTAMIRHGRT